MMLDFDWANPAAAAAAMMLFGEDAGHVDSGRIEEQQQQQQHSMFDHYGAAHGALGMDFFQQPLFSTSTASAATCHQRYGLALPPAPARIGLNLGVRTYFASAPPEDGTVVGRVCRRRTRTARCQAEGCGADLTHAKHYHRRHKVCEFHSKASIVVAAGLSQRFCQQCSRFHVLSEFDQGKRSCRKRLADHNRRRRKSQDLTTETKNNNSSLNPEKPLFVKGPLAAKPESCSSVTHACEASVLPATPVALGLGCGAVPASAGMSASSSTGTSPPDQSVSFLSHLAEFREHEHRFPGWEEAEDGSSIRGLFQNK